MRPVIGVTSNFGLDPDYEPPRERAYLLAAYTDAVAAAGGIPHILPVPEEHDKATLDPLLESVDGLLLTGGYDLHPRHWEAALHPKTIPMHPRREAFELALFRRADAARIPMLAICLGFQIAHVARGGRLVQDIDDLRRTPALVHYLPKDANAFHAVQVERASQLARIVGATEFEVNSRHHQVVPVDHQGAGLRPAAFAPDGILEASEDVGDRFLLAVQWHPEDLYDRPEHLRLFAALVDAALLDRARERGR